MRIFTFVIFIIHILINLFIDGKTKFSYKIGCRLQFYSIK